MDNIPRKTGISEKGKTKKRFEELYDHPAIDFVKVRDNRISVFVIEDVILPETFEGLPVKKVCIKYGYEATCG